MDEGASETATATHPWHIPSAGERPTGSSMYERVSLKRLDLSTNPRFEWSEDPACTLAEEGGRKQVFTDTPPPRPWIPP